MHDKHGNLIELGDVVRGWGYNLLHEVIGPVASVSPGVSCNLSVIAAQVSIASHNGQTITLALPSLEHGTASDFEIVTKALGKLIAFGPFAGFRSEKECRLAAAVAAVAPALAARPGEEPPVDPAVASERGQ